MPQRRPSHSFTEVPLPITRRVTDSGKKEIREACIYLVSGEPLSALMKHVRSVIQRSGMAEQLIRVQSEQYILKFLLKPEMREQVFGIFVLERFSGSIYEELRKRSKENNKCRIVSPLTIIQAAKQDSVNDMSTELRIPFKPYPLLSMAMSRLSGITLSGDLAPDERKDLSRMIALMGGSLHSNGPNTRTSVVVGRKMCDTRCVMARQMDPPLPIVSPDWIHHCYAESEKGNIIDGREKYRKYQLTPFAGFKLSPAQISRDKRQRLQTGAERSGYEYLPDLTKGQTTHLICEEAEGEKWEAARSWGVHCVSYDWVVSSIETGFALPEKDFLIGPVDENDASESVTQSLFNETRFERKRMSKSRRSDPINHLTQEVRRFRGNGSPSDRRSDGSQGLSTLTEGLHVSEVCEEPDDPPVEKESSFTEEYGHLLDDPHDDVFDGLEFSLISCDPEKASFMKKLIQSGSGYLQPRISEDVNYVLVGRDELDDEANDLMEQFKANDSSATFVSYKWLIASAEKNTLLDVEEYQFGDIPDDSTPATPAAEHPNLGFKVTKKDYSQRNAYKSLTSISFSGSISDSIGDQALIDEYSRRSDSTQSKSRAGAADTSSQDEDLTGNSQWKRVGAGLLRDDQSVTEREEWDDACSVISSYASIAADNTKSNVPIVLLASQFASHAEHGQPQAARVQRPQAILNVNNNNALSDMQVRERERRMNSSAASRPGNRAPGRNRRQ